MTVVHKSHFGHLPCGFKLHRHVFDGVPVTETEPMRSGTRLHDLRRHVLAGTINLTDDALRVCDTEEERELLRASVLDDPWPDRDSEWEVYFAINRAGEFVDIPLDEEADPKHDILFAGRMDRVIMPDYSGPNTDWGRLVTVEDVKFGRVWHRSQDEADMYAYGGYAIGISRGHDIVNTEFWRYWVRYDERDLSSYAYTPMDTILARIGRRIDWLLSVPPNPIPGAHCFQGDGCQFLGTECPLGMPALPFPAEGLPVPQNQRAGEILQEFLSTGIITPENEVVAAFGIWWFDSLAKQGKDKLKQYLIETGKTILFGDHEWRVGERDGDAWDTNAALAILKEERLSWEEQLVVLTVGTQTIKRLNKIRPDVAIRLYREARVTKPGIKELRFSKVKGE
jgi:hypothetical protein